jgi:hypothetical protein
MERLATSCAVIVVVIVIVIRFDLCWFWNWISARLLVNTRHGDFNKDFGQGLRKISCTISRSIFRRPGRPSYGLPNRQCTGRSLVSCTFLIGLVLDSADS